MKRQQYRVRLILSVDEGGSYEDEIDTELRALLVAEELPAAWRIEKLEVDPWD